MCVVKDLSNSWTVMVLYSETYHRSWEGYYRLGGSSAFEKAISAFNLIMETRVNHHLLPCGFQSMICSDLKC